MLKNLTNSLQKIYQTMIEAPIIFLYDKCVPRKYICTVKGELC